ncbi:putative glycoside hydrolase, family 28, pectin lyase/virulence factor [Helianthus annuus]|nr:putative glycoside hydrolase, family 28, pectin lyase/virulence factor [Helianthus annuus]
MISSQNDMSYPTTESQGKRHLKACINGAPVEWLPYGGSGAELYQHYRRPAVLSHEELLCVVVKGIAILAPVRSPNTDGINLDSCANTRIVDCYIVSGDDCVSVKSSWDEYGIAYGMPTQQLVIRRLTCISPMSAVIALGSEMSGGIQDVRAEDIVAINSESGVRIKTGVRRGGFVKDIYVKGFTMHTMKLAFWMMGNYGSHLDDKWEPNAIPVIQNINYRDMVAENVTMAARLEGIATDPFTGICISNVIIGMSQFANKPIWNCTDVEGMM